MLKFGHEHGSQALVRADTLVEEARDRVIARVLAGEKFGKVFVEEVRTSYASWLGAEPKAVADIALSRFSETLLLQVRVAAAQAAQPKRKWWQFAA